jgi:hypothetical protein
MANTKLKKAGGKKPLKKKVSVKEAVRVPVIRNNRLSKNLYVRDIGPASGNSAHESFTINKLTTEDMPQIETVSRQDDTEVNFHVDHLEHQSNLAKKGSTSALEDQAAIEAAADRIIADVIPKDTVRIKFVKFVNLVASRDFREVVEQNTNEEVIISSNLLTELAGSQDRVEERKIPLVFVVGIAIGVVLTYIFFST